jgi:type IV pilus assembly protein PilM
MVRLIEMPKIEQKELRSALRYEIGDLLPIPLDQAVFDFSILGPGKPTADGGETTKVLVVVAQKDIVWEEIAVVKRAGLRVRAVDASPLALLRAVPAPGGSDTLDAVVSLGAQLVVVAVRQGETPMFLRTATVASETATEPAARVSSGSRLAPGAVADRAEPRTGAKSDPVVEEIRSSIEYFLSHAQGARLDQVQLTGGGTLVNGFSDRLSASLGIRVVGAAVAPRYDRAALGLDEAQLREASHRWTTAVGLALWGSDDKNAPSLLPSEIEERSKQRRTMLAAGAGVVVVAAGLGFVSVGRVHDTSTANGGVASYQAQAAALQVQIGDLSWVTKAQTDLQARRELAQEALSSDVDWVNLDKRIDKALPRGVVISDISFSATAPATSSPAPSGSAASPASAAYVGTITMTAQTNGLTPISAFIDQESKVPGVGAIWVSSSTVNSNATSSGSAPASHSGTSASAAAPASTTFQVTALVTGNSLSNRASNLPGGNS